jgi:glycosyltransferase involved in cell wall biosynthesis
MIRFKEIAYFTSEGKKTGELLPVSVIIHTLNEEVNLPFAIKSVSGWANEIFLMDSNSLDSTQDIARNAGLKVYSRECTRRGLVEQRNWALDNLPFSNEWVFILDADEVLEESLKEEIKSIIYSDSDKYAYWLRFKTFFLNKWIKYSSMYPSWSLRLFKHKLVRYEKREANSHPVVPKGKEGYLQGHIWNYDRRPFSYYLQRINEFSTLESEAYYKLTKNLGQEGLIRGKLFGTKAERRRYFKNLFIKMPFKPIVIFIYLYFIRLGFLDGKSGLYWAFYKMVGEWATTIKLDELKQQS